MSHTPSSQEETYKPVRSKDEHQDNILAFPSGQANAAHRIQSEVAQHTNASAILAAAKPVADVGAIKTRYLHDAIKDTKSRLYPGPCVIASIAGVSSSKASDAIRQARYGSRWLDVPYTPPIKTTRDDEIEQALRLLGYVGYWRRLPGQPTLAVYLNGRAGMERDHPCIVFLSTHCVAVSGGVFCDVFSRGVVVDIDEAKGRRKKISRVFVLTKRVAPLEIVSRTPAQKADANRKADRLFREAIKAETGCTRIKLTPHEVFVILPNEDGWYWLGSRDSIEDQILIPRADNRLAGNTGAAATYRKAMGS